MKKRNKKKLGKVLLFILKSIFYYPFKALAWLFQKLIQLIKKEKAATKDKVRELKRDNSSAKYDSLKLIKAKKGDINRFEEKLYKNKSTIGLILGARGTGKSAIGMRLLENYKAKTNKNIYALGFKEESLPRWIKVIININDLENNSVILIDEGGIEFSSRKAMTNANKILSEILLIARHKDLSVIFITQNSANLEVNAIRQADYLILKPSSLLQKDFERKKIRDIYEGVDEEFSKLKDTVGITYIFSDEFLGFITNSLPSFWSEKVSKGYANKKN
ncbi:hypothetical protein COY27_01835 [Candidatus Woesearchaeota archaeon CG_4_10_14_0_2_um_filter_33_13]|nr:MAG: hypothetical protein COY27_01835 [Candidatus Woesearchaeota archaeon CG_4_10_14_0_2_um_filter_33_13]